MNYFAKILILTLLLLPFSILALELEYPSLPGAPSPAGKGLPQFLRYLYQIGLGLGFLIGFLTLLYSSFLYLTSLDNPERQSKAKKVILSGALGLFILFSSYVILSSIDQRLVIGNLQVSRLLRIKPLNLPKAGPPIKGVGCRLIPIQQTIEAIHKLEEKARKNAHNLGAGEGLLLGKTEEFEGIMPILESIYQDEIEGKKRNCSCDQFKAECLTSESWVCPATCPPDQGDPCTTEFREKMAKLEAELEKAAKKILELLDSWNFKDELDEDDGKLRRIIFEMIMDGIPESPETPNGDESFIQFLEANLGLLSNDPEEREERIQQINTWLKRAILVQIVSLERNLRRLTEAKMKFEKERYDMVQCRANKALNLLTCAQVNEYGFGIGECKELDFYCCP